MSPDANRWPGGRAPEQAGKKRPIGGLGSAVFPATATVSVCRRVGEGAAGRISPFPGGGRSTGDYLGLCRGGATTLSRGGRGCTGVLPRSSGGGATSIGRPGEPRGFRAVAG